MGRRSASRSRSPAARRPARGRSGDSRRRSPPRRRSPSPAHNRSPPRRRSDSRSRQGKGDRNGHTDRRSSPQKRSGGDKEGDRSKSRSPIPSQPKTAVNISSDGFESVTTEVVEAKQRHDGTANWQAELLFSLGTALGNSGRPRTMIIRGPYRPDRAGAEEDADKLRRTAETE